MSECAVLPSGKESNGPLLREVRQPWAHRRQWTFISLSTGCRVLALRLCKASTTRI